MGKFLVVGIHNDEEIMKHRCRPLYNEHERYRMIGSIKWVDEVIFLFFLNKICLGR